MTNPFPSPQPGIRQIPDPQAEMERLAEARKAATAAQNWPLMLDEVHSVERPDGSGTVMIRIRVNAESVIEAPSDLGESIASVVHVETRPARGD